jgi:hypothetical protein
MPVVALNAGDLGPLATGCFASVTEGAASEVRPETKQSE